MAIVLAASQHGKSKPPRGDKSVNLLDPAGL